MYIRIQESPGLGFGQPPGTQSGPLRVPTFTSTAIRYKDNDSDDNLRATKCSVYLPSALRNEPKIDLMVFFHGWDTCSPKHKFDPERVIQNFKLDDQVENAQRKVALAVPSIFWKDYRKDQNGKQIGSNPNGSDLMNIRVAWSAAYLNDFVEEVLDKIGLAKGGKSGDRPLLGNLILAGHSFAYNILTPLADQFLLDVRATKNGALKQLNTVLAMDTTYGERHAKALENWARSLIGQAEFTLVLNNGSTGTPPAAWKSWRKRMDTKKVAIPQNLKVEEKKGRLDGHCDIVKYVGSLLL